MAATIVQPTPQQVAKKKPAPGMGAGIMEGDQQQPLGSPDKVETGVPAPQPLQQTPDLEAQNLPQQPNVPAPLPQQPPSQQQLPPPPQPPPGSPPPQQGTDEDPIRVALNQIREPGQQPPEEPPQPGGVTTQQGLDQLNADMRTRFNRTLSQQEMAGLQQALGAPQGPNGTWSTQQIAQARAWIAAYSGDINNPFPSGQPPPVGAPPAPTPAAPPAATPGGVTAEAGVRQLNEDMIRRLGRPLTQQEIQGLAQIIGAPANPDGTYSAAQLAQAREWVGRYSGNINAPWDPLPESAPGSPSSQANTRLTELLGLSYGQVDPNSQAIQQPLGAFRASQSRAADRARMVAAQRNQAQGISPTSGAADAQIQSLLEAQGLNEATYEAGLYANELSQQRGYLMEAIKLAQQGGFQNKARELQEKLGLLDIELRKLLGKGQLALGSRSLDLQAQGLSQADRHFLEQMGFNYNQLQGNLNNQAIQALLQGL